MNSKFLYAATIAVSLISTLAMADEAPLTRAQVNAQTRQAIADGTLRTSDYDVGYYRAEPVNSNVARSQVVTELAQAQASRKALVGPLANRTYNPFGTQILERSTLARNDVKQEVRQAQAAGTLQRSDYDYGDASLVARRANQHVSVPTFAQRLKAKFSNNG